MVFKTNICNQNTFLTRSHEQLEFVWVFCKIWANRVRFSNWNPLSKTANHTCKGTAEHLWDWGGTISDSILGGGGTRHVFLLNLYSFKNIGETRAPLAPLLRGPWYTTSSYTCMICCASFHFSVQSFVSFSTFAWFSSNFCVTWVTLSSSAFCGCWAQSSS